MEDIKQIIITIISSSAVISGLLYFIINRPVLKQLEKLRSDLQLKYYKSSKLYDLQSEFLKVLNKKFITLQKDIDEFRYKVRSPLNNRGHSEKMHSLLKRNSEIEDLSNENKLILNAEFRNIFGIDK